MLSRLVALEFSEAFTDVYCESKLDALFDKIGSVEVVELSEDEASVA